jgi:hypothetical protein
MSNFPFVIFPQFVFVLSKGNHSKRWLLPEDFVPLIQDIVDTHPGLGFLKEATEFHSRYVHTVSAASLPLFFLGESGIPLPIYVYVIINHHFPHLFSRTPMYIGNPTP